MKIADLIQVFEESAPISWQESYDNSGLIIGKPDNEVQSVLICLDVIPEVVEEAIRKGIGFILSHHPLIFKGLKRITGSNPVEKSVFLALENGISIAGMHTNLDNSITGVNFKIGEKLGVLEMKILQPMVSRLRKLVVFCPDSHAEIVRKAVFAAGAGHIGNYDSCSYNISGQGTFRGNESSNPFSGVAGELHYEAEQRIETIVPDYLVNQVIAAMLEAHPYEEVAYDIYPLENSFEGAGAGMIGSLINPLTETELLQKLNQTFGTPAIRHSPFIGRKISTIAWCGGSGAFLIPNAIRQKADVFVSADFKYHDFFEADGKILLIDAGHFETEQFTKELMADKIRKKFPNFAVHFSEVNTNAVRYFIQ